MQINKAKRLYSLIVCLFATVLTAFANNTTYYSSLTATAESGLGKVYVAKQTTAEPTFNTTSTATNSGSEANQTYHLYAQPEEGFNFAGWYADSTMTELVGEQAEDFQYVVNATSTTQNNPTKFNIFAHFIPEGLSYNSRVNVHIIGEGLVSVMCKDYSGNPDKEDTAEILESTLSEHTYQLVAAVDDMLEFDGWYTDEACTERVSGMRNYTLKVSDLSGDPEAPSEYNFYARFRQPSLYQLGNAGFEDWEEVTYNKNTCSEPYRWSSFFDGTGSLKGTAATTVQLHKSDEVREGADGNLCAKLTCNSVLGIVAQGNITNGCINMGSASATDGTGNYNYVNEERDDQAMHFEGRPDTLKAWVRFKAFNSTYNKANMNVYISTKGYYQDPLANTKQHEWGTLVGHGVNNTIESNDEWTLVSVPFEYYTQDTPYYILATFSTSATPGRGDAKDYMYIDDLEMIYNDAKLDSIVFNGVAYDIASGSATIDAPYNEAALQLCCHASGAYIEKSYDVTTGVLSVDIKGGDYGINPENEYSYTIQFGKAKATLNVEEDNKWTTFCAPIDVEIPAGVFVYTVDALQNDTIWSYDEKLNEADSTTYIDTTFVVERSNKLSVTKVEGTIPANTAVVVGGKKTFMEVEAYAEIKKVQTGLLTGTYEEMVAPEKSYILTQNDTLLGFIPAYEEVEPVEGDSLSGDSIDPVVVKLPAGSCYIANGDGKDALILPIEDIYIDPSIVDFVCTDGQAFGENEGSDKAFDGDVNTKWCKNVGDDSFALISASKPVHVWGYELTTANDNEQYDRRIRGLKLYATNDAAVAADASSEEWIEIASEGPNVEMQAKKNFYTNRYYTNAEAPKTAYQYFKLQLTDGGFIQFSEFNFLYETEEVPVRYKWVEGSAENSAKVTDLDVTTKWEGSLAGNWFIVEAEDGEAHEIKSYAISTHDDGSWGDRAPKHWTIEASNDKENWETIAEVDNDPIQNVSYTTYEFNVNTTEQYRYIKMNLIEMKGNGWQQMGEFYVNASKVETVEPVVDFVLEEAVIDTITDSSWGSNDVYYTATFTFKKPAGAKYAYAEGLMLEGDNTPFQAGMYGMVELEDGDEVTIVYKDPMLADTDDESYEGDFRTPGTYKASTTIMFMDADQIEIMNDEGKVLTATFNGEITLPVVREEEPEIPTYYLTGGGELLGGWNSGNRIEMPKGEVSLTLPRGTYEFKVWPTNDAWSDELGYSAVNQELSSANIMGTDGNNIRIAVPYEQAVTVKVLADKSVVVTGVFVNYAVADVYTVVGDEPLVGSNWDLNDANNEMTLEGDSAVLVKTNVDIKAGSYKWKVVGDHSWNVQYPAGDFFVEIPEDGVYNITFKLNVATGEGSYELDVVTGINSINALENATIFTIDGKKVEKINGAGLYIINGVKVSVK